MALRHLLATVAFLIVSTLTVVPTHATTASSLPRGEPLTCLDADDLVVQGRSISARSVAIEVSGNCDVEIVDSHIVSDDVALVVNGNGTVRIVNSFIQGQAGAVRAGGNGDVHYRGSTLRGGLRRTGNSELHDLGGNTVEVEPQATERVEGSIHCTAGQRLTLAQQAFETNATAIVVEAGCALLISDATIRSDTALDVRAGGVVRLRNARLDGAILVASGARVHAAGSSITEPAAVAPEAEWINGGGNDIAGAPWDGAPQGRYAARHAAPFPDHGGRADLDPAHGASETAEGLAEAARVLSDLARGVSEVADQAVPTPSADPSNPLVGAWRVSSARFNGRTADAGGTVAFYRAGTGLQNLWIATSVGRLPLIGGFRWSADDHRITIDADGEISRWQRLEAGADRQHVRLELDGGEIELILRRAD